MLGFSADTKNEAKCIVTHGTMGYLDPKQPPIKRRPFVNILNHHFIQKLELILPEELYEVIKDTFLTKSVKPAYSRVIMPLQALLDGDFFNDYIKKGNILMLSRAMAGFDKIYSLREGIIFPPWGLKFRLTNWRAGILTLYLDKETYERAGLVGKPDGVKGKRGTRPRWVVEINLRLPSMLHGKKGFDRILYAFKNVLKDPVTWLFQDLGHTVSEPEPIDVHFPTKFTIESEILRDIKVIMPRLKPPTDVDSIYGEDLDDFAIETHEWLSMISLNSPRIESEDKIDSFLSRYAAPGEPEITSKLVRITWRGFLPTSWVHKTFVEALLLTPRDSWLACSVGGFEEGWSCESKDCTILRPPDAVNEYVLWEVA